jgi:imidazolonepropionase
VSSLALTNIATLVSNSVELGEGLLGVSHNQTLIIQDGLIHSIQRGIPQGIDEVIDCSGKTVLPGFVDSHTHLIFAGDRSAEFAARSRGEKYSAGGIRTTVAATRGASDDELRRNAQFLLNEALAHGTTTVEIKSGYGLTLQDEIRSLKIAQSFTDETTLLAAHVIPQEYIDNPEDYVSLIIKEIIPASSAKWIDVFCDSGAYSTEQTRSILRAGTDSGMKARIHANQLSHTSSVNIAIEFDAASADHLSESTDSDIEALASSNTVATLLPGAEFSTQHQGKLGRRFLDAKAKVAIATDCNPGSSFTTSMPFCISAAVSLMGFSVEEAVYAATAGGAKALRRSDIGTLAIGNRADLVILNAPTYIHLAYRPGINLVDSTLKTGRKVSTWLK